MQFAQTIVSQFVSFAIAGVKWLEKNDLFFVKKYSSYLGSDFTLFDPLNSFDLGQLKKSEWFL